ncbi:MAG: glutaredoxin family protein [Pseudomonadota bacterium]
MSDLSEKTDLVLYSRAGCHLCDDMLDDLEQALRGTSLTLSVVDIDTSDELVARYGERVPVLHDGEAELCAVRLDPDVAAALAGR